MSDSGNAFALVGGTSTPPDYDLDPFLVPNAPYARGGHHFSNGPTWVEQLARSFALAGSVRPAFASESPGRRITRLEPRAPTPTARTSISGTRFRRSSSTTGARRARMRCLRSRLAATTSATRLLPTRPRPPRGSGGSPGGSYLNHAEHPGVIWSGRAPLPGVAPPERRVDAGAAAARAPVAWRGAAGDGSDAGLQRQLEFGAPAARFLSGDEHQGVGHIRTVERHRRQSAEVRPDQRNGCMRTPNAAPFFCGAPDNYLFWDGIHPTRATHAIVRERRQGCSRTNPAVR